MLASSERARNCGMELTPDRRMNWDPISSLCLAVIAHTHEISCCGYHDSDADIDLLETAMNLQPHAIRAVMTTTTVTDSRPGPMGQCESR